MDSEGWIKTTCAYCGVGCGVEARPKPDGQLEVRGDKSHPANFGKLCTKGIALGETVIEDGRLTQPKVRTERGFEPTDWHDALSQVADTFRQTIEQYGPDSVAFYVSGQLLIEDYYVANKLMKGFIGSSNIDSNSRLCMASSVVGHKRAFGSDTVPVCYEDIELAEVVLLIGSNLAWCHPVLYQRLRAAKQQNPAMKIVVVDPRRNESCEIADLHLPLASGSDVALFNGLLHYLVQHDYLDHNFVTQHTDGFQQARDKGLAIDEVAKISGLQEEQIELFYQYFAQHKKVLSIYSQGVNQSSQGSDKVNSIINCHLATGKIGLPGMGPFSVTGQPNAMGGREVGALASMLAAHLEFDCSKDIELLKAFWHSEQLALTPGLKAVDMFDAIDRGEIKAIWIMATNPVVSLPNSDKIKRALTKCPLVVVSDCIEDTATTAFADILLPAQGWSEKSGTVTNSERRLSRQRRLLPSPGDAKPDWWMVSEVAKKMGFSQHFNYVHEGDIFREYAQLTSLGQQSRARDLDLSALTVISDKEYQALTPQQWPVKSIQKSVVNQRFFADKQFYTANKKAQFIAVKTQLPSVTTNTSWPLLLNSGRTRDHWHTMTRTGLSTRLGEFRAEPYLLIHPDTMQTHGLQEGKIVKVSSPQGHCLLRVIRDESMQSEQVFAPIHWNEMTASNAKVCQLIDARIDSFSGQPEFKHTPVKVEPVTMNAKARVISQHVLSIPSDIEYWAREKVANGYLYHLESTLSETEFRRVLQHGLKGFAKMKMFTYSKPNGSISLFIEQHQDQEQVAFACHWLNGSNTEGKSDLIALFNDPDPLGEVEKLAV
ncbi:MULTISPECIES: molybdopterin oxidoreductase family protein [unclassified Vibrio]|uniref:Molybdopterin oxidoreductase family protein n=1 Tax=Vibrio sp. HB236076 TaxID=3232307 RepID=A0AB39HJN3_9VIBR|nr:nitrate reductase [Vibrio sp. HB161653]MDP5254641.1 nitrate reductase [Vibrio sp. HB161653]